MTKYSVVGAQPTTLIHEMASGVLNGSLPRTAELNNAQLEPIVSGGQAKWSSLTDGGLYNFVGKSIVVEALSTGTTWKIVDDGGIEIRALPPVPFRLAPNEKLQAVGGSKSVATVRLDIQKCI